MGRAEVFATAPPSLFFYGVPVMLLGLVLALCIKNHPLRSTIER